MPTSRRITWTTSGIRDGSRSQQSPIYGRDPRAVNELAELTYQRLQELVTAALRRFPVLQRVVTADDVVHGHLLKRLQSALVEVRPETAQHLFRLAGMHIRYELLSLIRRRQQERRVTSLQAITDREGRAHDPVDTRPDAAARLANWECFNEKVDQLPEELRAVVDLLYFQRMSQRDAAMLLGVTDRTIRNRLQ
ncbi:MAG: RNA polymerase sigma factor, partial [Planctomycetota bacterium]